MALEQAAESESKASPGRRFVANKQMDCAISAFPILFTATRVHDRDMRIAGLIAVPAAAVTFIVNQVPDPGAQVILLMVSGLAFGLPWAFREIRAVFGGLIVGLLLGMLVLAVDATIGSLTGPAVALVTPVKWLAPIFALTAMASAPLHSSNA